MILAAVGTGPRPAAAQAPLTSIEQPDSNGVIALEFGLRHPRPRRWSGRISTSAGEVLSTWGRHFVTPDRIKGAAGWDFSTRLFMPPNAAYKSAARLPKGARVLPNGVWVSVKSPGHARVSVETNHGRFSFPLDELKSATRLSFLDGDAQAVYTPAVRYLTRGEATQHDFPAAASGGGGLYVVWTSFHNEANLIYMAERDGGGWKTHRVSAEWGDYYGNAVAVDGAGAAHVVWSEYRDNRWMLVSRRYDPASGDWDQVRPVAAARGRNERQLFPVMTTDADGHPWVGWQGFGDGKFDVWAARWTGERWSEPVRVSESGANDWAPTLAAAPDGSVYAAWDGYDAGHYDISLRRMLASGSGIRLDDTIRVTRSETYDAHPSLAVDGQNRVWLAWTEAGPNWGKDWGVLGKEGTQVRESRRIRLVRYAGGRFSEPARELQASVPDWLASMHEYPRVAIGPNGLPYVFFRRNIHRLPMPEHELQLGMGSLKHKVNPWHDTVRQMSNLHVAGFDGADWLPVRQVPQSGGRASMQMATAPAGGRLFAAWPVDGRSYADPHFRSAQIHYAEFEMTDTPAASDGMQPFISRPLGTKNAAPTEAEDVARARAVRWGEHPPLRLFRGDLHRHTDISADSLNDGDMLDAYRYAMDAASLDFLAVTDHTGAERMHYYKYQWWRTRQVASMFNLPGTFVTFFGYERTVAYPGGHRNIISTRREAQPVPISDEESYGLQSYGERLFPVLKNNGDISIPHTTAGGGGTDWRDGDAEAEPLVEIFQALRGSYEEPNAPASRKRVSHPKGLVWRAWSLGRRLGVITSSDHHSTHQSYACVYAPEFTAESIHAAMKQRRTYGATDNIVLKFDSVAPGGKVHRMGEEFAAASPPRLRVVVEGTAPIETIELIRNGRILLSRNPGEPNDEFRYVDNQPLEGVNYYHVRLVQANRQIAWSSPIWVDVR